MNISHKFKLFLLEEESLKEKFVNIKYIISILTAPKCWIMNDMGREYRDIYYQQRLAPLEILYDSKHLQRLYEADAVNTQYVQSIICEEYEK